METVKSNYNLRSAIASFQYTLQMKKTYDDPYKYERGIKCCKWYLLNIISLKTFCKYLNKYGLHEDMKNNISQFMPKHIVEKYIGYDEVD